MSLQNDLDAIEMKIADYRHAISNQEAVLSALDEKRKAAQELKAYAQELLSKPATFCADNGSSHAVGRGDLAKTEEVLAKIAHSYGPAEEKLRRDKVFLEGLLEQKRVFPMDRLREQQRIQRLRARLT